jgi:hypothetical protein
MSRVAWWLAFCLMLVRPVGAQRGGSDGGFDHRRHAKLFPTCEGCHAGIVTGDASTILPSEAQCRECHNGTDERVVRWRKTSVPTGLLRFSHAQHASKVDTTGRACATCHAAQGAATWMNVRRAQPETCTTCHAHPTQHLAEENRCATCHVPLTSARDIPLERIARFPKPPSHEQSTFSVRHASPTALATGSCAVCHARESCATCHVNASLVPAINTLARDARVARHVAGRVVTYPEPADHSAPTFRWTHGDAARLNMLRCGSCHARPSCQACHAGALSQVLQGMPVAERGGAKGVELIAQPARRRFDPPVPLAGLLALLDTTSVVRQPPRTVRVHDIGYKTNHRAAAASRSLNCASCHAQRFCTDCHAGEASRRFHVTNFVARHAADGYRRENECATCHNAEAFCRECHRSTGLASRGRLDAAFHTAQPQWLLQHGRAARQGLATCTTCHAQRDCLTCHSTTGWGVNPHGPGFDAARLARSAAPICLRCHVKIPG